MSGLDRAKRRRKPRRKFRRAVKHDCKTSQEKAKAPRKCRGESSRCHSEGAMRALRDWVGENVTNRLDFKILIF